jgi:hypothetical protein
MFDSGIPFFQDLVSVANISLMTIVPETVGTSDEDGPVINCAHKSEQECYCKSDLFVHILENF